MTLPFSTTDLALARRTEAAEAANGFALAAGAGQGIVESIPIAGGCALFGGVGSPMTHALGIGMSGPVPPEEFDRMEEFFHARGSASLIDLCPLADLSVVDQVVRRGYKVIEFNNLMLRQVESADAGWQAPPSITITPAGPERFREWCQLVFQGFAGLVDVPADAAETLMSLPSIGDSFFGALDGEDVSAAASSFHSGIAMLYGDATLAEARGRGLQTALIRHRLAAAARAGCDWAMACVVPGTASHRNYERCGFNLFYMRVNVQRDVA